MVILDGKFPYINLNATLNGGMKHRLLVPWMGISLSISNSDTVLTIALRQ
jgi:hypothetical protein